MVFMLLFAGFAIKVPLFPFHTWLPLAHVEAPTAGSILLAGVLLKVGGYGFLRFNMAMTPIGAAALFPMLATISVAGILYGALAALAQTDVKRLVAYSSVSHMGFIALGIFSMTRTGTDGAVIQMVNHGITTGALFACVGVFYERYHTREMGEVGGLWERLPVLAFFLILASLGSAAVPGLNGFVGEFPILLGMFARRPALRDLRNDRDGPRGLLSPPDAPASDFRPPSRARRSWARPRTGDRCARSAGTRSPGWLRSWC